MKVAKTLVNEDNKSKVNGLASGVLIGYAITCTILIAYSILITYSNLTGENLPMVVTITSLISVIVAGFDTARYAENKGWLWGIVSGFIYAVILVAIGIWVNKGFKIDSRTITMIILSVAGGGLGGVVGINFRKKS